MKRPWPGRDRLGLDRLGLTQTICGLILGLIALFSSYDHIPSPAAASQSSSNGASLSSLPRWRQFLSDLSNTARHLGATLNWRRDPGYEQRTRETEIAILRERQKRLHIEKQIEQIDERTKQIENETEQLKSENARERALSALIKQHCFPPESSSSPQKSTEPDCGPSSP